MAQCSPTRLQEEPIDTPTLADLDPRDEYQFLPRPDEELARGTLSQVKQSIYQLPDWLFMQTVLFTPTCLQEEQEDATRGDLGPSRDSLFLPVPGNVTVHEAVGIKPVLEPQYGLITTPCRPRDYGDGRAQCSRSLLRGDCVIRCSPLSAANAPPRSRSLLANSPTDGVAGCRPMG
jgi:hypothetical protein